MACVPIQSGRESDYVSQDDVQLADGGRTGRRSSSDQLAPTIVSTATAVAVAVQQLLAARSTTVAQPVAMLTVPCGAEPLARAIAIASITIRMCTTHRTSTVANTIAAATACTIAILPKCKSQCTTKAGTTNTQPTPLPLGSSLPNRRVLNVGQP